MRRRWDPLAFLCLYVIWLSQANQSNLLGMTNFEMGLEKAFI